MIDADIELTLRGWFADGDDRAPSTVVQAALSEVATTPQRHGFRSRILRLRFAPPPQRLAAALAIAILAVLGAAVAIGAGAAFLRVTQPPEPRPAIIGPSPSPSPSIAAPPEPSSSPPPASPQGHLFDTQLPVSLALDVLPGWYVTDQDPGLVQLAGPAIHPWRRPTLFVTLAGPLYSDPCSDTKGTRAVGPTVLDLASALAATPGVMIEGPDPIAVDGHEGLRLTLTAPPSPTDCPALDLWGGPNNHWLVAGEQNTLWILDVDGHRIVISAEVFENSPAGTADEQEAMVASIRLLGK